MPKCQVTIVATYDLDPKHYPDCDTPEGMVAVDEQNTSVFDLLTFAEFTETWEVAEQTKPEDDMSRFTLTLNAKG